MALTPFLLLGFAETRDSRRMFRSAMLLDFEADKLQGFYGMNLATAAQPHAICRRNRMRHADVTTLRQHVALFRAAIGDRTPAGIPP
jgi:hypothetical protein